MNFIGEAYLLEVKIQILEKYSKQSENYCLFRVLNGWSVIEDPLKTNTTVFTIFLELSVYYLSQRLEECLKYSWKLPDCVLVERYLCFIFVFLFYICHFEIGVKPK